MSSSVFGPQLELGGRVWYGCFLFEGGPRGLGVKGSSFGDDPHPHSPDPGNGRRSCPKGHLLSRCPRDQPYPSQNDRTLRWSFETHPDHDAPLRVPSSLLLPFSLHPEVLIKGKRPLTRWSRTRGSRRRGSETVRKTPVPDPKFRKTERLPQSFLYPCVNCFLVGSGVEVGVGSTEGP